MKEYIMLLLYACAFGYIYGCVGKAIIQTNPDYTNYVLIVGGNFIGMLYYKLTTHS